MNGLTMRDKLGYGVGALGDAISYTFIGTFLMFFLTTVVGISPAVAGTITVIGAFWNAVYNPMVGYFSDKVRSRWGRRRPVIFAFALPMAGAMTLLFSGFDMPSAAKNIYYAAMVILFWSTYTGFFVPYLALGAEYTRDYNDRTALRMFASLFNMLGAMMAMVLPTSMVEFMGERNIGAKTGWMITAAVLGIISMISIWITVYTSKSRDLPNPRSVDEAVEVSKAEKGGIGNVFREYIGIARLKPVKYLIFASLFSLIAYSMILSDLVYYLTYNQRLSGGAISVCLLMRAIIGAVLIPVVGKSTKIVEKRIALIGFNFVGIAGLLLVRFTSVAGGLGLALFMVAVAISTCVYWILMPAIFYDVCEYDLLITGNRREGSIVSFMGFVEAMAVGIGSQVLGWILELTGFNSSVAVQSDQSSAWIENCITLLPIIFLLGSSVALYRCPLTKKVHDEIVKKLEAAKQNV